MSKKLILQCQNYYQNLHEFNNNISNNWIIIIYLQLYKDTFFIMMQGYNSNDYLISCYTIKIERTNRITF